MAYIALMLSGAGRGTAAIRFEDFASAQELTLVGDASVVGQTLCLTPAKGDQSGAAWFRDKQPVGSGFDTTFQFQLTQPGGLGHGADGFAFVIQNSGPEALGGRGSAGGERFAAEQQRIKELDPGLAAWEDLDALLQEYAEARAVAGFCAQRFTYNTGNVESVLEPARVITFDGSTFFACGDYSGAPVFGPEREVAQAIGLNSSPVTQALRRLVFPPQPSGAAHVRWPVGQPPIDLPFPFGVLVLLKQTLRSEQGTWSEVSNSLHCFLIPREGPTIPIDESHRAVLLRMTISFLLTGLRSSHPSLGLAETASGIFWLLAGGGPFL